MILEKSINDRSTVFKTERLHNFLIISEQYLVTRVVKSRYNIRETVKISVVCVYSNFVLLISNNFIVFRHQNIADTTQNICSSVVTGVGEEMLLVRNARAEQRSTSKMGAYFELSNSIPIIVREAMMYKTKIKTEIGVMPCKRRFIVKKSQAKLSLLSIGTLLLYQSQTTNTLQDK